MDNKDQARISQEYLVRHIEPTHHTVDTEINKLQNALRSKREYPQGVYELMDKGMISDGDFLFKSHFSELDKEKLLEGKKFNEAIAYEIFLGDHKLENKNRARILTHFELEAKGNKLDITSLLPPNYRIIYKPSANIDQSGCIRKDKTILLGGDLTSLETVLTALHEVGHAVEWESLTSQDQNKIEIDYSKYVESLTRQALAELDLAKMHRPGDRSIETVLRLERNAWSFALRKIAPLIGNDVKDTLFNPDQTETPILRLLIQQYVHRSVLKRNTDAMRSMINKRTATMLEGK